MWWGICIWLCYKFPTESTSERILKIGQYLVKLWARVRCLVFLTHGVVLKTEFIEHSCSLEGPNFWINYTEIQWYKPGKKSLKSRDKFVHKIKCTVINAGTLQSCSEDEVTVIDDYAVTQAYRAYYRTWRTNCDRVTTPNRFTYSPVNTKSFADITGDMACCCRLLRRGGEGISVLVASLSIWPITQSSKPNQRTNDATCWPNPWAEWAGSRSSRVSDEPFPDRSY